MPASEPGATPLNELARLERLALSPAVSVDEYVEGMVALLTTHWSLFWAVYGVQLCGALDEMQQKDEQRFVQHLSGILENALQSRPFASVWRQLSGATSGPDSVALAQIRRLSQLAGFSLGRCVRVALTIALLTELALDPEQPQIRNAARFAFVRVDLAFSARTRRSVELYPFHPCQIWRDRCASLLERPFAGTVAHLLRQRPLPYPLLVHPSRWALLWGTRFPHPDVIPACVYAAFEFLIVRVLVQLMQDYLENVIRQCLSAQRPWQRGSDGAIRAKWLVYWGVAGPVRAEIRRRASGFGLGRGSLPVKSQLFSPSSRNAWYFSGGVSSSSSGGPRRDGYSVD